MKRAITFMMALVLVLSLSVSAFAAPGTDGSITITNATKDLNYKLYKIFEATYVAGGTDSNGNNIVDTVAYTLKTSSPVYNYMFNGLTPDENGYVSNACFTYHIETGVITKVATADTAAITAYLTAMVRDLYNTDTATSDDCFVANQIATSQVVAFTGLGYGYYLIDTAKVGDTDAEKAKIAVTITTNTPSIEVIEKNQLPGGDFNKDVSNDGINWEADDKNSLGVGDTVYFKLNFTATNYDGDEKVTYYKITDTMEPANWADIDISSIVVKVAGSAITNYTVTETANGFEINIPWVNGAGEFLYPDVTSTVEVTYHAVVTEFAADKDAVANKNTAQLDWDYDSEPDAPGSETETDVFNMGFTKVDGADPTKTLPGAVFGLYSDAACTTPVNVKTTGTEGVYMVDPTSTTNSVVTPANGQVVIQGLAEGTYYLKETTAPDGYNLLADAQAVEVGKGGADELVVNGTTYVVSNAELNIANNSGVELPSTGGKGTMMLITFGSIVAMAFAVLMITQKKMSIYQD